MRLQLQLRVQPQAPEGERGQVEVTAEEKREKQRIYMREWRKKNPEKQREHAKRRWSGDNNTTKRG